MRPQSRLGGEYFLSSGRKDANGNKNSCPSGPVGGKRQNRRRLSN
jgi:hypothetical protein